MKLKLLVALGMLIQFYVSGQNIEEFDELLSDPTIKKRLKYRVSVETGESELTHIVKIDRAKRQIIEIDSSGCENGCSWRLTEYGKDWKPYKKTWYVYDTARLFVYNYYYDSLGLMTYRTNFKTEESDGFKTLKPQGETEYFYNSKGVKVGYINTNFIDGDSLKWKKNKGEYKLTWDGKIKKKKLYIAEENSDDFSLWRVANIKYSFFGRNRKKYTSIDPPKKSKSVTKYKYKDGKLIFMVSYNDGEKKGTSEYKFENGLKKEHRIKSFTPGHEMDFIVRYEYIR